MPARPAGGAASADTALRLFPRLLDRDAALSLHRRTARSDDNEEFVRGCRDRSKQALVLAFVDPARKAELIDACGSARFVTSHLVEDGMHRLLCAGDDLTALASALEERGEPEAGSLLRRAHRRRSGPPEPGRIPLPGGREIVLGGGTTRVMGIVNVTPDSFFAGSRVPATSEAVERGSTMLRAGAAVIDVGGESTRPGAPELSVEEEKQRVVPVVAGLRHAHPDAVLSVDTRKSEVAAAAVEAGADFINDVSAGTHDPEILSVAAERGAAVILMHMRGTPATMQQDPRYSDVVAEIGQYLWDAWRRASARGLGEDRVLLDPGIGFGKTLQHNLALLRSTECLMDLGFPLVLGTSRKSFLGAILDREDPADRLPGSLATVALASMNGVGMVRVHDVEASVQVSSVLDAIRNAQVAEV